MIVGIGCDIVNMKRIERIYSLYDIKLLNKVLHKVEIDLMPKDYRNRVKYIAKRFAVKEAYAKAIGSGIGSKVSFKDVWVEKAANGRPILKSNCKKDDEILHLSISDDADFAIAYVVIERI